MACLKLTGGLLFAHGQDVLWTRLQFSRDHRLTCALRPQIVNTVTKMQGLQRGQRVQFDKKHIVSIKCGAAPLSRHSLPCLQLHRTRPSLSILHFFTPATVEKHMQGELGRIRTMAGGTPQEVTGLRYCCHWIGRYHDDDDDDEE